MKKMMGKKMMGKKMMGKKMGADQLAKRKRSMVSNAAGKLMGGLYSK